MGCGSSKDKYKEVLAQTDVDIQSADKVTPLDDMDKWIHTLNDAMDYYVGERNAQDKDQMHHVQDMAIKITNVLLDFITEDKVVDAADNPTKKKELDHTLKVFGDLDKIRSSPATPLAKDKIKEYNIALAKKRLLEAQDCVKDVSSPEMLGSSVKQILGKLKDVLKLVEQLKDVGTAVQPFMVQVIKILNALVQKLHSLVPNALEKDQALYSQAEFCAQRIDAFAVQLQPYFPSQPWQPCVLAVKQMHAQFEQRKSAAMVADEEVQLQHTLQVAFQELQKAQDELDKVSGFDPKVVATTLEALAPLWPKAQKDSTCSGRLSAICDAVEVRVLESVDKALAEPEETMKLKIRGLLVFAQTYDNSKCKLIKPDGAGLTGAIKAKLDEARKAVDKEAVDKAIAEAGQSLTAAEEELQKDSHFNPKIVVESLEKLVQVWQQGQNSGLRERLKQVYDTVEDRVAQSVIKALEAKQGAKVEALKQFASTYDEIWCKLEGLRGSAGDDEEPSPSHLGLKERIVAYQEVAKFLGAAEEELAKEHGMKPPVVLSALRELRVPWEQSNASGHEFFSDRVKIVMTTITARVAESYESAVNEDSSKKQEALLKFAQNYDATCAGLGGEVSLLHEKLAMSDVGKQKREKQLEPKLNLVEQELQKEPVEIEKVLEGFLEIQPFWEKSGATEEINSRLEEAKKAFSDQVTKRYGQCLAKSDESALEQLRRSAQKYDLVCLKMAGFFMPDDDDWAKDFKGPLSGQLAKMQEIQKVTSKTPPSSPKGGPSSS